KMKFSVNWLREFVELPPSIDALAELLTMSGIEIEAIEKHGTDFDHVVVAQITESKPHPNADRLTVCVVDDGSGTKRQIVCGAKKLGVAEDAAGLLILSPEAKIGTPIRDLFPPDTILDVEITPNRGDLLSHFGLAREIAALTANKLRDVAAAVTGGSYNHGV